ncbi:developmentally-regulated protein [Acrasis kona]|uniref:Developmentally-regulated protein n=1 Tax=Acrasis kona TaxID=1008807 RepID=A0AAW2ZR80_9EUKA
MGNVVGFGGDNEAPRADVFLTNLSKYTLEMIDESITQGTCHYVRNELLPPNEMHKVLGCSNDFSGTCRYHFCDEKTNDRVKKYYHFEMNAKFIHNELRLKVTPLFSDEVEFPITHDISTLNNKFTITICDRLESNHLSDWNLLKLINEDNKPHKVTSANNYLITGIVNSESEYRTIPFVGNKNITHVRLFDSQNDSSYILVRVADKYDTLMCTTVSYESGYWHDIGTDFDIHDVCCLNNTVIVLNGEKLLYKGDAVDGSMSHYKDDNFQFIEKVNQEKFKKIDATSSSLYALSVDNVLFRFSNKHLTYIQGVLDFFVGLKHVIVVVQNGLIWYNDSNGDFQPENSLDLSFNEPSIVRIIANNSKSCIMWTHDNRCFVVGSAPRLIGVKVTKWCQVVIPKEMKDVKKIIGSSECYHALTESGELWVCDSNQFGFLRRKHLSIVKNKGEDDEEVEEIESNRIIDISNTKSNITVLYQ